MLHIGGAMVSELKIKGMTCGHCKMHVEEALTSLAGVASATVDLKKGKATVAYDETKVSLAELKKAVTDTGYEVQ